MHPVDLADKPVYCALSRDLFLPWASAMEILDPAAVGFLPLCFLVVAAFLAGLMDSVAGGGGLISLPATLLVGVPPHLALGTGKFMASVGTMAAFLTYARSGMVAWRIVATGTAFSLLGAVAGTQTALHLDSALLGRVILVLLPVAAALTFLPVKRNAGGQAPGKRALWLITPLICVCIGFYDGFFGPGTGSFMLLALHFFLGLHLVAASATAKAFNLASNLSSLVVFVINGEVFYAIALPMALACMSGNILGARLALKKGPGLVRRMLLASLSLLFLSLLARYW
jgi:uncharacterized membrane protein YfcA